jgi:RsiW-degrading membrane proteinase PrsW (M82 family)
MSLLLLALIPALVVLYYYYNKDRHPEPWGWVALVFVLGALSIGVALPLELWAQRWLPAQGGLFLECLLIPGLIEEAVKLAVVVLAVFWRRDFNEPVDGLIYGMAAALGFTFAEDWLYYLTHGADWSRIFSTVAHPWFSCFWASSLGWAKFRPWPAGVGLVLLGLGASMAVHGLFDFLILASDRIEACGWLRLFLTPLLIVLYLVVERQLETARLRPAPRPAE